MSLILTDRHQHSKSGQNPDSAVRRRLVLPLHIFYYFSLVVCFVTDLWEENKKCDNGQRIRHLAAFNVDMLAQQAKKDKSKCPDSKSQAISILKVNCDSLK